MRYLLPILLFFCIQSKANDLIDIDVKSAHIGFVVKTDLKNLQEYSISARLLKVTLVDDMELSAVYDIHNIQKSGMLGLIASKPLTPNFNLGVVLKSDIKTNHERLVYAQIHKSINDKVYSVAFYLDTDSKKLSMASGKWENKYGGFEIGYLPPHGVSMSVYISVN